MCGMGVGGGGANTLTHPQTMEILITFPMSPLQSL